MYYIVRLIFLACVVAGDELNLDSNNYMTMICIKTYQPKNQPILGVTAPGEGATLPAMDALCRAKMPGYGLASTLKQFANNPVTLCPGDSLVPVKRVKNFVTFNLLGDNVLQLHLFKRVSDGLEEPTIIQAYEAVNLSSSETISVGVETKFRCAICEIEDRSDVLTQTLYPSHNNSAYAYDLELVSKAKVDDIGILANGSDLANKLLEDLAKEFEISVHSLRWHGVKLNEDHKAVVHVYYDRGDVDKDWFYYVHWNDEYVSHRSVGDFQVSMIKLSTECLPNKRELVNSKRFFPLTGEVDIMLDLAKGKLATRECYWDDSPEVDTAVWSPKIDWWIVWGICDLNPGLAIPMLQLEGPALLMALKQVDIESAFTMHVALDVMKSRSSSLLDIKALVGLTNALLVYHAKEKTKSTFTALLEYSLQIKMAGLYMLMLPLETNLIQLHGTQYANVLVAALEPVNPVVGMAVKISTKDTHIATEATMLTKANMSLPQNQSHIVVTMSDSVSKSATFLHIAVYGAHLDKPGDPPLDGVRTSWIGGIVIAFNKNGSGESHSSNDFVDIAFKPAFREPTQRGNCAEWMVETAEWYTGNCRILKSTRDAMVVCRCRMTPPPPDSGTTANPGNQSQELQISGTYMIYGFDASLSTFLNSNLTLVIVIVVVGIMSALGLLCVILTAVYFPEWRKDQGHTIFLHMIFALTVNLVLGFVNNFISIDTKSAACIGIGVVRHYSFLAMFVWMMTLSALQFRRLTTVVGSKATSHLILKVCLIAWGVPLIPIVILLAWNTDFYKSEVSNRGYCYPEGLTFQITVQAPVGVILVANMFIFVFILNHIYGWFKCNKDVVVRKHTGDERAEQLRRLFTTIFIFFLFGFTWVFHFLSEEGIINSEFLFEFLFLITASLHMFMLAFFFIVLDKNTRKLWYDAGFRCRR